MVIDRTKTPHRAVGDIRAVVFCDLVVTVGNQLRLPAEAGKRLIEPVCEQPFHMIAVVLDRACAATLPDHVSVAVTLPGLAKRYCAAFDLCLFAGPLAPCD